MRSSNAANFLALGFNVPFSQRDIVLQLSVKATF
jgi:hypothetical protein